MASAAGSLFARTYAGHTGVDPYTTAVSDTYQDLFSEGSFSGKGLYDVDAFRASVEAKSPENTLLSHDLIEGNYARAGLVTDIVVYDHGNGRQYSRKVLTTHDDPTRAVMVGVEQQFVVNSLDKLSAIPGFKSHMTIQHFVDQLARVEMNPDTSFLTAEEREVVNLVERLPVGGWKLRSSLSAM